VLNVLVAVSLFIALSGVLLRWRAGGELPPPHKTAALRQGLMVGLIVLTLASFLARRVLGRRSALRDPRRRARQFSWAHVLPALLGALTAPLGLAYGWWILPRLDVVAPFWVAALGLGFLAWPRASELEGFDSPMSASGEPSP
jgi:hypothetical protein